MPITFAVQIFDATEYGLAIGKMIPARSYEDAVRTARALVPTKAGAAAVEVLSAGTGSVDSMKVLQRFGQVPDDYLVLFASDVSAIGPD